MSAGVPRVRASQRPPWNDRAKVEFLARWWRHFGTWGVARELGLTRRQVKAKADKLGLKKLPKSRRLCATCRRRRQKTREQGLLCRVCHLARRKDLRQSKGRSLEQRIAAATRTARHRSKARFNKPSDLTIDYMARLWRRQGGKCAYTGASLRQPVYLTGRADDSPSIDRIKSSRGYVKGNVAWVTWRVNWMKANMPYDAFVRLCGAVVKQARRRT
jgi:hypothetical protein